MSNDKKTMYQVLSGFLQDPERQKAGMALDHAMAYYKLHIRYPQDDPRSVVESSPSDIRRFAEAKPRAGGEQPAASVESAATGKMVLNAMNNKASLMDELKTKVQEQGGAIKPSDIKRPGPTGPTR